MTVNRNNVINLSSLAVLVLIGWIDYITGYEFGFFIFYFIPVSIAAWFVGRRSGLFMACASALTWYLSDLYTDHPYSHSYFIYWEMFMRLVSFLTTALTISRIRELVDNERRLNGELVQALGEVGELQGLLPICPECGKFHADEALQEKIAKYLAERRGRVPSRHSCPECGSLHPS
jgi:K+-sensing histidine kinase KdpD